MSNDLDLGLETLLAVRSKLGIDVSDHLLKQFFEIQKRHQFNHDRTASTQAIEKLVELQVDQAIARGREE